RRQVAFTAILVALALLVFFVIGGNLLLRSVGIAVHAFQIAGGIILFLVALEMIQGRISTSADAKEGSPQALAIYPLAFPLIGGPGSFITVIFLTDDDRYNFWGQFVTVGVVASVLAIQFAILLSATALARAIGSSGVSVIGRIMGMLLAAMAVGMVLTAVGQWLNLPVL